MVEFCEVSDFIIFRIQLVRHPTQVGGPRLLILTEECKRTQERFIIIPFLFLY